MNCPICQSPSHYALTKDAHPYFRCEKCDFLFHRPEAGAASCSIPDFYDQAYWEMERAEAMRREKEDSFLRAVELLFLSSIPVTHVLDFGCGLGVTVQLLRDKLGVNAVGVDISADFAETPYLHKCPLESMLQKYPPGHFDAIYSIEVFEHLEDPRRVLSLLKALLKPGGKILLNTGTQEYMAKYDPEMTYIDPCRRGHISIYSLKSLLELAATIGYAAEFLAARSHEVILFPAHEPAGFPHPDNLEHIKNLGDWSPQLWREYMRLVFLEKEFEDKGRFIAQLLKLAEPPTSALGKLGKRIRRVFK